MAGNLQDGMEKVSGKIKKMRNLAQYKDMTDEEFDEAMNQKPIELDSSEELEQRIEKKLAEFERDYDLSELKINDWDALRALIQAHLTLEDYEQFLFKIRSDSLTENRILSMDKLHRVMSDLRSDISKLQGDLSITRKNRKADQDASLEDYIQSLKEKAKKFYESKMSYIFCEKCSMLLATTWVLYGKEEGNKVILICNRTNDDGSICGHKNIVSTSELLKNGGTNNKEVTPESML